MTHRTMHITLACAPADAALANQIRHDLQSAGFSVHQTVQPGSQAMLVIILSPAAATDPTLQKTLVGALDNHQHVIPALASAVSLPRLIDHLQPLDFTQGYDAAALLERLSILSAPDAPPPLTVLTPSVRASNRQIGYIMAVIVALLFLIGLYLVAVKGIQAPLEEFNTVETFEAATRDFFIRPTLNAFRPRSTEEAANFPATVEAVRTEVRPFLIFTATAQAD